MIKCTVFSFKVGAQKIINNLHFSNSFLMSVNLLWVKISTLHIHKQRWFKKDKYI